MHDLRYAIRMLIKHRGFSLAAIITLGLGIGANTAIFSVINSVLLRPLPFSQPDQIVALEGANPKAGITQSNISLPDFVSWQQGSAAFSHMAPFYTGNASISDQQSEPQRVPRAGVTDEFFPTLGVQPFLGRAFTAADGVEGAEPVAILGYALWQRVFGGDRQIIGRQVNLNARNQTIIGVMPPGFDFPQRAQIWNAFPLKTEGENRDNRSWSAIARLRDGVSRAEAQTQLSAIDARLAAEFRDTNSGWDVHVIPLYDWFVRETRPSLLLLSGAVAFVLLIACANVANLLLVRTAARRREMAIRAALGARRSRVIRQLLTESALLAVVGGALGLLLSVWFTDLLVRLVPADAPRFDQITLDGRVLVFALGISLVTGLIFGLIPAWHATRAGAASSLNVGDRNPAESVRNRARSVLLIGEVALSLILLVGAGLLMQSLSRLREVNPGFKPAHLLTASLSLPRARYPEDAQRVQFFARLVEALKAQPEVAAAGAALTLPLGASDYDIGRAFVPEGKTLAPENSVDAVYDLASPAYFETVGIPLVTGRLFTLRDDANAPMVVIVNQKLAIQQFGSPEKALGKRLTIWRDEKFPREIVGVVGNTKSSALDRADAQQLYVPHSQDPSWGFMSVAVRTRGDSLAFLPTLRREVHALDKDQPVYNVLSGEDIITRSAATRRVSTFLITAFAAAALLLAALGIYSVIAYTVMLRLHEIGIRMALGAQASDVFRLIVGQGIFLAAIGIAAGLLGAFALTRVMSSLLFNIHFYDPLTFGAVAALLFFVALVASYFPARRATKLNPVKALSQNG